MPGPIRHRTHDTPYVWVTTPDGKRRRKWAYGKTRQDVNVKWLKRRCHASRTSIDQHADPSRIYGLLLREVVVPPRYAPLTCATYETLTRLYICCCTA